MITIEDPETGEDKQVYTAEEVEAEKLKVQEEAAAKIAEIETHSKEKLDQFVKAKQGIDTKEEDFKAQIEEAKSVANAATAKVEEERQARFTSLKNFVFEQYGGADPEVKAKLEASWNLINLPVNNEEDVKQRVKLAADLSGLSNTNTVATPYGMPVAGGYAPNFNKPEGDKTAEHAQFINDFGLQDLVPTKE